MPKRKELLTTGEIYHVFNRGVEKRTIFQTNRDHYRFLNLIQFYMRLHHRRFSKLTEQERNELIDKKVGDPIVEMICYSLMPNHFHLMIKQVEDSGIQNFIRIVADGYSHYFNIRHNRVGTLFQGKFKAVRIEDDSQLLHVSRYIHINSLDAGLVERLEDYPWSSYQEYVKNEKGFCSKEIILGQFKSQDGYQKFVEDYGDYGKKLARIEHLILEKPNI